MEFFHLYFDDYMLQQYTKEKKGDDQQQRQLQQEQQQQKERKEQSKPRILDNTKIHRLKPEKKDGVVVFVGLLFIGLVVGYIGYQQLGTKESIFNLFNRDETAELPGVNDQTFSDAIMEYKDEELLIPLVYYLDLTPNLNKHNYSGSLIITVKCIQATSVIKLNSIQHKIKDIDIKSFDENEGGIKATALEQKRGILIVELASTLIRNHQYNFTLNFVGNVTENNRGMFLRQYQDGNGKTRELFAGLLEFGKAKYVFPCFQDTKKSVKFQLTLTHANSLTALSNMRVSKTVSYSDGSMKTIFQQSPMNFDHISFVLAEYSSREFTTLKGYKIRLYAPKGRLRETEGLETVINKVIQYYGVLFGMPYSLKKLDIVPVPMLFESTRISPGLAIVPAKEYLLNPDTKTSTQMENQILCVAQALVKQLFGCLKNAELARNPRFIKSFSLYLSYYAANYVYPSWNFMDKFYDEVVNQALTMDEFGRMQYSNGKVLKGAAVLQMMTQYVGQSKFHESIMLSCNKQTGHGRNLIDVVFKKLSPVTIRRLKYWLNTDSFPLISMTKGQKANQYIFKQASFLSENSLSSQLNWPVPILAKSVCKSSSTKKFALIIKKGQVTLDKCYLHKVNVNGDGYYRVKYANSDGIEINELLNKDHKVLSARDRANLINDLFEISRFYPSNLISALNLTSYLNKEREYLPFKVALTQMKQMANLFDTGSATQQYFQKYIRRKIQPVLDELKKKQSYTQKKLIGLLTREVMMNKRFLGIEMDNMFLKFAISKFKQQPPPYLRKDAFQAGVMKGGEIEWNILFKYFKSTPSIAEKDVALDALTVTRNMKQLGKLKDYTNLCDASSMVCMRNKLFVWTKICANQHGNEMIKSAFVKDWRRISNSPAELNEALESFMFECLGSGRTDADMKQVQFMEKKEKSPFQTILSQVIKKINHNIALRKSRDTIKTWLLSSLK